MNEAFAIKKMTAAAAVVTHALIIVFVSFELVRLLMMSGVVVLANYC